MNQALLRENLRIREEAEHWRREAERSKKSLEALRLASGIASAHAGNGDGDGSGGGGGSGGNGGSGGSGEDEPAEVATGR